MADKVTFRAVIEDAGGGGAFVQIPFDVEQVFGRKRVPIRATIDGEPYRGTLVRMGTPCHVLIILKDIRARIGKEPGDEVEVSVEEDTTPRVVEVPADLKQAFEDEPEAKAAFEKLAYTHKKEYVTAILEAKRAETRERRIVTTLARLKKKK